MPAAMLEEEPGVHKSGIVSVGWTPVKSKKQFYAVLVERALELHESEKTYRKKKPPKHTIDLSVAFNVHTDHFDPKMKRCMCLCGPDDALLIKGENDNSTNDWYSAILDALIPARATRLGRPVQPLEFFEYVWDVEIVQQPKLKRAPKIEDNLPNMCEKTPGLSGPKRLCFYAHTIILCKRRIESVTANLLPDEGVPPFAVEDFIELSRKYIATFGSCEKYFLIRMGRMGPMGAGELWVQCESEEIASDIHDKLNRIIEREAEKKKKLGNGPVMPSLPHHHHRSNRVTDPALRERINTLPVVKPRRIGSPVAFIDGRGGGGSRKTSVSGTPVMTGGFESPFGIKVAPAGPAGRINSVGSLHLYGPGKIPSRSSEIPESVSRKNTPRDGRPMGLEALSRLQPNVSQSTQEETEDSGGTLRLEGSNPEPDSVSMNSRRSMAVEATIERHPPSTSEDTDLEATSSCSSTAGVPPPEDYAPMDTADWTVDGSYLDPTNGSKDKQYHLDEVRSYVSDSSDSCYSSLANNTGATLNKPGQQPPRAYSFGARTVPQAVAATFINGTNVTTDSGASLESASKEALAKSGLLQAPLDTDSTRLRAFSLGSKHLFTRPFRKLSQNTNRSTRHSQTTASGVSLASSSNASSSGQPTTSSSTHQISAITSDAVGEGQRNRSGSFGSGRSTPFNRRGGSVGGPGSERGPSHDHLVEIDFGGGSGMGRSGSGSVHSVDSPSRSRTSSFGGKTEFQRPTLGEPTEEEPIHEEPHPVTSITQSILKNSIFKDFHGAEYGDYVPTQINDPTVFVQAGAAEEVAAYCGQHHLGTAPQDVGRQSQHFETIQETTSGNNSRCSSRTSIHKIDDDYALMDGSEKEIKRSGGRSPMSGSARARSRSSGRPPSQSTTPVVLEADEDYVGCKIASLENGRNSEMSSEGVLTIDTNVHTPTTSTVSPAIHRAFVGKPSQEHKRSHGDYSTSPLALPSNPMPKPSSVPHQMNETQSTLNYAMLQVSLEPKQANAQKGAAQTRRSRSRSGTSPGRFGSKLSAATSTCAPMAPETIEYTILQGKP